MSKGFTLAEVLVAIAIVAVIGTILVLIFTNTLRGSNKSQILSALKQNGQVVLDSISRNIRSADNVVCPISGSSNIIVTVKNGTYSRYRIVRSSDIAGSAPADCIGAGKNGCVILDNPTPLPSETSPQLFLNRICNSADPMPLAQILTDTNPLTGVSVESGSLSVSKPPGFKAIVTVNFVLQPGVSVPQIISGQIDPVTYETSIEVR